ncbi:hypothetical protein Tco_1143731 [Tanacetum coccineum]
MEITGLFPFDTYLVVQIIATRYSIDALNLTTVANWYAWYDNSKDMRCHRPRQVVSKASKFLFMYIVPHVDSATDGSNVVEDEDQLCVPDGKQDEHVTRPSTVNPLFSFWSRERTWVFRSKWWPWITAGYQGESPPDDCWLSLQGQRLEILGVLFSLIFPSALEGDKMGQAEAALVSWKEWLLKARLLSTVGILLPEIASRRRCRLPADEADSLERVSGPAAAFPDYHCRLIACASGMCMTQSQQLTECIRCCQVVAGIFTNIVGIIVGVAEIFDDVTRVHMVTAAKIEMVYS